MGPDSNGVSCLQPDIGQKAVSAVAVAVADLHVEKFPAHHLRKVEQNAAKPLEAPRRAVRRARAGAWRPSISGTGNRLVEPENGLAAAIFWMVRLSASPYHHITA